MRKTYLPLQLILAFILVLTLQEPTSAQCICESPPCGGKPLISVIPREMNFFALKGGTSKEQGLTIQAVEASAPNYIVELRTEGPFCVQQVGHTECITKSPPFREKLSLNVVFKPTTAGSSSGKIFIDKLFLEPPSCINNLPDEIKEIRLTGTALDELPRFEISPTNANFVIEPGGRMFGTPITFTITAFGGSVQSTNIQFFDQNGTELDIVNIPFRVEGFPPFHIVSPGAPFTFMIRPFLDDAGPGPPFFRGTVRFTAMGIGIGNELIRVVPISINLFNDSQTVAVPTLGQWGVMILSLLLITAGLINIARHSRALAGTSVGSVEVQLSSNRSQPLFALKTFGKVLAVTLAVTLIGIAIFNRVFGPATLLDIAGTLVCALILAYVIHLLILVARNSELDSSE